MKDRAGWFGIAFEVDGCSNCGRGRLSIRCGRLARLEKPSVNDRRTPGSGTRTIIMPSEPVVPSTHVIPGDGRPPHVPRSTLPYYAAGVLAAGAIVWYMFVFVPAKLEYFVGLRLRTLAVAAGQVKTKAENLASALNKVQGGQRTANDASAPQPAPGEVPSSNPGQRNTQRAKLASAGNAPGERSSSTDVSAPAASTRATPGVKGAEEPAPSAQDAKRYLSILVPEVQLTDKSSPVAGLQLQPTGVLSSQTATVAWTDVTSQAAAVSRDDFDDLILALPSGEVVWQREQTTPRIGNLAQVLDGSSADDRWFSFTWSPRQEVPNVDAKPLPTAVIVKEVAVGGRANLLVVQAVTLSAANIQSLADPRKDPRADPKTQNNDPQLGRTVYVAGLVSMAALRDQAMHVPIAWVVTASLPLIVLFLALPFIKLATLTARERFSFVDALLLIAATIAMAGLATTIPLTGTSVEWKGDRALAQFADAIEAALVKDVGEVQQLGEKILAYQETGRTLATCRVATLPGVIQSDRACDLWATAKDIGIRAGDTDLDVVIWLDEAGQQIRKWTTKAQVTGSATHRDFQHFRDLIADRVWTRTDKPSGNLRLNRFTIEPLRAPTTAELGVIFAFPFTPTAGKGTPKARFLALNVRPAGLLDVVVPPTYGFAVITPGGKVLFHSQENLSLEENFFEEVGDVRAVRTRAQSGHVVTWSGDYHGRPHRIHLRQLNGIAGSSWRIVTFRDMEPMLAGVIAHQAGTLRLATINLLALTMWAALVALRARLKRRDVHDVLSVRPVTNPRPLRWHLGLIAVSCAVLLITYASFARVLVDWIYLFFVLLPFAALGLSMYARRTQDPRPPTAGTRQPWVVSAELALLVLLVAAFPAAGFARLVEHVQTSARDARWLEEMQARIAARNEQVLARVNGPAYASDRVRAMLTKAGFARTTDVARYAYLQLLPAMIPSTPASHTASPTTGQEVVRFLINWNPFPSRDLAGQPPVVLADGKLRLEAPVPGPPPLSVDDGATDRPPVLEGWTEYSLPAAKLVLGVVLLCGTIAGAYWARRKLLADVPVDMPTLETVLTCLPPGAHGVLLIGAPRTQKDAEVRKRCGGEPFRIRLLDSVAEASFVDAHVQALVPRRRWWSRTPTQNGDARSWIHISNLETHLVDAGRRKLALRLLERVLEDASSPRVVIVTSNIDPVAHFEEVFEEERKGIYEDAIPEVELSRFSLLLTRFRRCYLPLVSSCSADDPWWDYRPEHWMAVLEWETRSRALADIRTELQKRWESRGGIPLDELSSTIAARAEAMYQLFWTSCTRREKLVLVQLAQEGFVTPQSREVVSALMAKGLVIRRPCPAVFNYTFRAFLRRIERGDVVRQWELMEGRGLWVMAGRLVSGTLVAGGAFFLLTQGYSVEGLLPVLSGTGIFGVPLVRTLIARLGGKEAAPRATA